MKVQFRVKSRKAASPLARGVMLDRGYVIVLEPDKFELHAKMAESLKRNPAWERVSEPIAPKLAPPQPSKPTDPTPSILTHQQQVIDRIRAASNNLTEPNK